jgi:carboxyl-terminal processing protease
MNNKLKVWLPFLFGCVMSIGIFLGYKMKEELPGRDFFAVQRERPEQQVMDLIEQKYVDSVNLNSLGDTAIQAILGKLDPHSKFIAAEEVQKTNDDLAGNFYGVGIEYQIYNDTINIISIIANGPAAQTGLQAGDKFLKVNDSVVAGKKITSDQVTKLFHGEKGSTLNVVVLRGKQQKTFTITRDLVSINSVSASYMLTGNIGYIKLDMFTMQSHAEFLRALEALQKQGMKKLILDLRDNGGGILEEATEIADDFLDGDKLITYTVGTHFPEKEYRCQAQGSFEQGPLAVLIDENTASASEILSGALQDWDRATIIGRRSFGKGLVQEQYDLNDGSALRLTVARYYTPVGRSIQRPYNNGDKAYYDEVADRYEDGELTSADSIKQDSSKVFKTVGGRIVYGGGGIMPDIFVGIDTTLYDKSLYGIYMGHVLPDFAYNFYLQNETLLNSYKTIEDFKTRFIVTDEYWNAFTAFLVKDSVWINKITPAQRTELSGHIKAYIARQLWNNQGFFELENPDDKTIQKAVEVLNSKKN